MMQKTLFASVVVPGKYVSRMFLSHTEERSGPRSLSLGRLICIQSADTSSSRLDHAEAAVIIIRVIIITKF